MLPKRLLLLCVVVLVFIPFSISAQTSGNARTITIYSTDGASLSGKFAGADNEGIQVDTGNSITKVKIAAIKSIVFTSDQPSGLPILPPQGKALIYFYREASSVRAVGKRSTPVYCDGEQLARLDVTRFFVAQFDPGQHSCVSTDKSVKPLELNLVAGQTYFMKMSVTEKSFSLPGILTPIASEEGALIIKQMRAIKRGDIKDSTHVMTDISEP